MCLEIDWETEEAEFCDQRLFATRQVVDTARMHSDSTRENCDETIVPSDRNLVFRLQEVLF